MRGDRSEREARSGPYWWLNFWEAFFKAE